MHLNHAKNACNLAYENIVEVDTIRSAPLLTKMNLNSHSLVSDGMSTLPDSDL